MLKKTYFELLIFLHIKVMNFYVITHLCANYIKILIKKKPAGAFVSLVLKNYVKLNLSYTKKRFKYM